MPRPSAPRPSGRRPFGARLPRVGLGPARPGDRLRDPLPRPRPLHRRADARLHAGLAGGGELAGLRALLHRPHRPDHDAPARGGHRPGDPRPRAGIGREPDRTAPGGLAHPHAGRAHGAGGAEPARHLGKARGDALRPRPALQPLAARAADAGHAVLAGGLGRDPVHAPVRSRVLLRTGPIWEACGTSLAMPFAGLHVIDATKQLYRPIAVAQVRRARRLAPARVLVPAPAPG